MAELSGLKHLIPAKGKMTTPHNRKNDIMALQLYIILCRFTIGDLNVRKR